MLSLEQLKSAFDSPRNDGPARRHPRHPRKGAGRLPNGGRTSSSKARRRPPGHRGESPRRPTINPSTVRLSLGQRLLNFFMAKRASYSPDKKAAA